MTNEVPAHPNAAPQGPPGVPQQYPPQGYPPQGYPPQGYPPQGHPPQGYPPQGYPPQGYPPQGAPPGAYPPQGYPPQGYPPQGAPPNGQIQQIIPPEHRGVTGAPIIVQPAIPSNTNYNVLTTVPKLYIKQKIDILEALTGFEQKNRYGVHLSKEDQDAGRKWLHAKEDSSCFCRLFFNPRHELKLKVEFPNDGPKILEGHRPCAWCLNHMEVKDPHTKNEIGTIDQNCTDLIGWCPTKTTLNDAQGHEMYTIEGPPPVLLQLCMMWPCRNPFDFKITKDGQPTGGVVQNVPNGCLKMCFTSADDYVITFPENANAEERAMILMYTFLLDYMFFQGKQQNRNNNNNTLML